MTLTPLGLPKAQPIAYIENIIASLRQLQLKLKANLIQNIENSSTNNEAILVRNYRA